MIEVEADDAPDTSTWPVERSRFCAFPPTVSGFTSRKWRCSPKTFGAMRGKQWPRLAVRRFFLFDVFLHELGHLQIVDPDAKTDRRRFASETLAQRFANQWRCKLWSEHFDHPDPVHNPPGSEELDGSTTAGS